MSEQLLREALAKYGQHKQNCGINNYRFKLKCDCGLEAALAQPAEGGEAVGTVCGHAFARHRSELTVSMDRFVSPGTKLYTRPAPGVPEGLDEDQLHTVALAADLLEHYAAYINEVKPDDIERHPYLPEIELTAADLRVLSKRGGDA